MSAVGNTPPVQGMAQANANQGPQNEVRPGCCQRVRARIDGVRMSIRNYFHSLLKERAPLLRDRAAVLLHPRPHVENGVIGAPEEENQVFAPRVQRVLRNRVFIAIQGEEGDGFMARVAPLGKEACRYNGVVNVAQIFFIYLGLLGGEVRSLNSLGALRFQANGANQDVPLSILAAFFGNRLLTSPLGAHPLGLAAIGLVGIPQVQDRLVQVPALAKVRETAGKFGQVAYGFAADGIVHAANRFFGEEGNSAVSNVARSRFEGVIGLLPLDNGTQAQLVERAAEGIDQKLAEPVAGILARETVDRLAQPIFQMMVVYVVLGGAGALSGVWGPICVMVTVFRGLNTELIRDAKEGEPATPPAQGQAVQAVANVAVTFFTTGVLYTTGSPLLTVGAIAAYRVANVILECRSKTIAGEERARLQAIIERSREEKAVPDLERLRAENQQQQLLIQQLQQQIEEQRSNSGAHEEEKGAEEDDGLGLSPPDHSLRLRRSESVAAVVPEQVEEPEVDRVPFWLRPLGWIIPSIRDK